MGMNMNVMKPTKYRKKPIVVEALRFIYSADGITAAQEFCRDSLLQCGRARVPGAVGWAEIATLEGKITAIEGDYIIKGIKGEFYPRKPDIFLATYEEVRGEERQTFPVPRWDSPFSINMCVQLGGAND